MSARFAHLRKALEEKDWKVILQLFRRWPEQEALEAALEYASHHLDTWPLQSRSSKGFENGPSQKLVKHLNGGLRKKSDIARLRKETQIQMLTLHARFLEKCLPTLQHCPHIQHLRLLGPCSQVESLKTLPHLKTLLLCPYSSTLRGLEKLKKLEELRCLDGTSIRYITALRPLKTLRLFECNSGTFPSLEPLENLTELQRLKLVNNENLTDITALQEMTGLRELSLRGATELASLAPLSGLKKLEVLDISECKHLRTLSPLQDLPKLKVLKASRLKRLETLDGLESLTSLEELDLSSSRLHTMEPLKHLTNLKKLRLNRVGDAFCAEALLTLTNLEELSINNHPLLTALPDFTPFQKLTVLDISKTALRNFSFLRHLSTLKVVHAKQCKALESLQGLHRGEDILRPHSIRLPLLKKTQ